MLAHPERIPRVLEESVRLYNLIISLGRLVTEDVEFHGVRMAAGDIVWIGNVSACRDPRVFEDPTRFDPERPNIGKHLGWGHGEHRCLGMHLARWEMAIAVEESAPADPGLPDRPGRAPDGGRCPARAALAAAALDRLSLVAPRIEAYYAPGFWWR